MIAPSLALASPASNLDGGTKVWESLFDACLLSLMIVPPILYVGRAEVDLEPSLEFCSVLLRDLERDLVAPNVGRRLLTRLRICIENWGSLGSSVVRFLEIVLGR